MLDAIYIPTYRRPNNQITWTNLPEKYQKITWLVVTEEEDKLIRENYPEAQTLICPVQGTGLPHVREWLAYYARHQRYFVFDDDLKFYRKSWNEQTQKWKSHKMVDVEEFDEAFETVNRWMDEGYAFGSFRATWNIPNPGYFPYADNIKIATNVFYDGPKVPVEKIDWTRCFFCEDFDVALQMHYHGFESRTSQEFCVSPLPTNAEGGVSEQRTIEKHNESMRLLGELWPKYVRIKSKVTKGGDWAGQEKLTSVISFRKAAKDFKKPENSLEEFM